MFKSLGVVLLSGAIFSMVFAESGFSNRFEIYGRQGSRVQEALNNLPKETQDSAMAFGMYFYKSGQMGEWEESEIGGGELSFGWTTEGYLGVGGQNGDALLDIRWAPFAIKTRYGLLDGTALFADYSALYIGIFTPTQQSVGSVIKAGLETNWFEICVARCAAGLFYGCVWFPERNGNAGSWIYRAQVKLGEKYIAGVEYSRMHVPGEIKAPLIIPGRPPENRSTPETNSHNIVLLFGWAW